MSKKWFEKELEAQLESGGADDAPSTNEFAALFSESLKGGNQRFKIGEKVSGKILVIGKEDVFVALGGQKEGSLPRRDLENEAGEITHQVGDSLDLFVVRMKKGEILLSTKRGTADVAEDLRDALEKELPVEGRVAEVVKGGFKIQIGAKFAFCPISQLDSARIEVPETYIGKKYEFKITQITEGGRNIVVSRKKFLDEQRVLTEGSFLAEHKAGDVVGGTVKRLEPYGAFVELAVGLEGLVHVSEIAWSRVANPADVLQVGQKVSAKILKIENPEGTRAKISLSIKQAGGQPWDSIPTDVTVGAVVNGKVTRIAKFGAFVELAPGIEGLVPLSEMSYTKRVVRAEEVVKEGESVLVKVKEISPDTRRISLSIKDAGEDPWALIAQKFPAGAIVKGKIERREPYGLFVKLEEGITGLFPKSKAAEAAEFGFDKLKVGDEVTVQIAEVRPGERRISLQAPGDSSIDEWRKYSAEQKSAPLKSFGSLGDLFSKANKKKA